MLLLCVYGSSGATAWQDIIYPSETPTVESTTQLRKFPVFLSFTNRLSQRSSDPGAVCLLWRRLAFCFSAFSVSGFQTAPSFADEDQRDADRR